MGVSPLDVTMQLLQDLQKSRDEGILAEYKDHVVVETENAIRDRAATLNEEMKRKLHEVELRKTEVDEMVKRRAELRSHAEDRDVLASISQVEEFFQAIDVEAEERRTEDYNGKLWSLIAEVQQLTRALHIYAYTRHQQIILEVVEGVQKLSITADAWADPAALRPFKKKLSPAEFDTVQRLLSLLETHGVTEWLPGMPSASRVVGGVYFLDECAAVMHTKGTETPWHDGEELYQEMGYS
ncbi:MAG: hypothetical protein KVP17_001211 [Porospora cf. gigantea B]|uniref:uncharacterized protein n=1 Tax=Porospora cf. gigantea B TaxID=2853592 RepID=UPI0035719BB3|nr:MAG: hypothetical protein KVP17_001211 [Porospora cf. gigantea B]